MSQKMRPIRETIPLDAARQLIEEAIVTVDRVEHVPLAQAGGRVVARDVTSRRDVPPFARASMDGYAVVAEDTFGASRFDPKPLRVVGTVFTGDMPSAPIGGGQAVEIATGAPMPAGADAVVMVEETDRVSADDVRILSPVHPRQNVG